MSRRSSLPGADELFGASPVRSRTATPRLAPVADLGAPRTAPSPDAAAPLRRRERPVGGRRPTGRERHDEKITVYVSPDELLDLEHARLALRGDHGLAVDRGRIVREALSVVLADLDARGDDSVLVQRLRGR